MIHRMNHSPTLENVCAKNALPQGRDGTDGNFYE